MTSADTPTAGSPTIEISTTSFAVGGEAVGRDDSGRVIFVEGALAGERVAVALSEERKRFARGAVVEVVEPSPGRIGPVCPEVARGCGGCDLAHASAATQFSAKTQMVADSLQRIGRLDTLPPILAGPELATTGFRTTIRAAVVGGRAGLRRRRSNDAIAVDSCRVAHPLVAELLVDGRFGDAEQVTIRVGARTGERMVIVSAGAASTVSVPDDVLVVGEEELAAGRRAWIHEEVAGHRLRISAASFFQTRPDGADALVDVVAAGLPTSADRFVDLCAGVGLFAATVGSRLGSGSVLAVESSRSAVADAKVNLAGPGDRAKVLAERFERWTPSPADVVVADPARAGLGKVGVAAVAATGAVDVALVSCDPASLGRDVGLFVERGYAPESVTLVDLFPDTSHVEAVTILRRR